MANALPTPHPARRNGPRMRATGLPGLDTRLALYCRVSSEDQAEKETIQAQLTFLRTWGGLYDYAIVGEYVDDPVSGLIPLAERPGGSRLLTDAQAGAFGTVAVLKVNRMARSLRVLLDGYTMLEASGVVFRSATEPFDTSTPMGKFLFQLLGSMAELDRATLLDQMSMGRDRLARAGKWTDGPIPLGYDVDTDKLLIPSPRMVEALGITEADLLRDLFCRIAQGSTGIAEATRLQAMGVPLIRRYSNGAIHQAREATWRSNRITTMIRSTIYRGSHTFKSRFGPIERQVPALVAVDLWDAANAQLECNRSRPKSNATRIYLLRGLIRCGVCGKSYVGQVVPRRRRPRAYYRCNGSKAPAVTGQRQRCPGRVLYTAELEDHIWARCTGFIRNPQSVLDAIAQQLAAEPGEETSTQEQTLALALGEKQQEEERLLTVFRRGRITLAAFEAEMDTLDREKQALQAEMTTVQARQKRQHAKLDYLRHSQALLAAWRTKLAAIEAADDRVAMQTLIADFVAGITIYPDRVEIAYRFEGEALRGAETDTPRSTDLCTTLTEVWTHAA